MQQVHKCQVKSFLPGAVAGLLVKAFKQPLSHTCVLTMGSGWDSGLSPHQGRWARRTVKCGVQRAAVTRRGPTLRDAARDDYAGWWMGSADSPRRQMFVCTSRAGFNECLPSCAARCWTCPAVGAVECHFTGQIWCRTWRINLGLLQQGPSLWWWYYTRSQV